MNTPQPLEPHLRSDTPVVLDDPVVPQSAGPSRVGRRLVATLAVAVLLLVGGWFAFQRLTAPPPVEQAAPSIAPVPPVAAPGLPAIRYPLDVPAEVSLPALNASDAPFVDALAGVMGSSVVARWLVPQELVRRIVVTVDNLPRKVMPHQLSPIHRVPGTFAVTGGAIAPTNAERYVPLVRALEAVDEAKLVALYVRWYPRFQDAYREQGYPNAYFNDRLVEALDSLLSTPSVSGGVAVVQPKVLWQFADPKLEALPAGQKILLRMGPDNAARVKAKIAAVRRLVANDVPR